MTPSPAIERNCLATAQFTLKHESLYGRHTEVFLARRMHFWRDLLAPEALATQLMGAQAGESFQLSLPTGSVVPPFDAAKVLRLPNRRFLRRRMGHRVLQPRVGRFYPHGVLSGLPRINSSTLAPCRVLAVEGEELVIDLNHPLAGVDLSLHVDVLDVARGQCETGGRPHHWSEKLCEGPGVQRPSMVDGSLVHVDFLAPEDVRRDDDGLDAAFYQEPRLVSHVDDACRQRLATLYARLLTPGIRVLDLMSSWQSHLPGEMPFAKIIGLGLNTAELEANPALTQRVVHDCNATSTLPVPDASVDAVLCALSIEYLTQPLAIMQEIARVLTPGGLVVLTVSQRWFPTKAIALWPELHPFERLGYMAWLLAGSGQFTALETYSDRGHPRPRDDRYFPQLRESDPLFAAWARKKGE